MKNNELLLLIEQLKKENEALKKENNDLKDNEANLEKENSKLGEKLFEVEEKLSKAELKLYETNQKLNEALLTISSLQEKVKIERTRVFIPKGEKLDDIVINEAEEILKEEKKVRKTNKGKKYNKKKFDYEKYVTETRIIDPKEKTCPICGSSLVVASSKVRYVVEVIPSKIKVIKLIKNSYKCPNCNKETNKIYYPVSNEVFGGVLTPSLATYILYHKYELGIPFEHLAKSFNVCVHIV